MEFFSSLWQHSFLQHALIAGLLASIGCGIIGTYVVVKRITFLAGGIAHSVLAGMGMAYYFGFAPLKGALLAALIAALLIGMIKLRWHQHEDTLIGALWAVGMAVGVLFISQTPGYNADLMSYLFGNILMVPRSDLYLMLVLDGVIIIIVTIFYKQFQAVAFDSEFARLREVPVDFFYLLLLCMVALTVVLLIQVVGLILVIALLTLPAAIAMLYSHSLGRIMLLATFFGSVFTSGGLALSYAPDLPSGATIILVAGCAYMVALLLEGVRQKLRRYHGNRRKAN
jgi:zinc transport system permease protein